MPQLNMCHKKRYYLFIALGLYLLSTALGQAQTAQEKGLAIAQEADQRDLGFSDYQADMIMELRNRHGDKSVRHLRISGLEVDNDGDKTLSIFDQPKDIKGTAMLTHSHKLDPDDQWLYLPALKRVKRISSRNKSGPFMGSEFAFEDLGSQEVEKYKYKYLQDENIDGVDCFVVERYPQYQHSGYQRQVAWYDKAEYRLIKIVFYDRKNALLKTLTYQDYHQYLNKYWRANIMNMENHQTQKGTTVTWSNYQFRTGLTDRNFDRSSLKRAR